MSYIAYHEQKDEQERLEKMANRGHIPDNSKRVRLIDANAIKFTLQSEPGGWGGEPQYIATKEDIAKMPTVDAVEVVRCKDCKKWNKQTGACAEFTSHRLPTGGRIAFMTREVDFCSHGERRDAE